MKIENLKSYNNLKSARNCSKSERKSNIPNFCVQNKKLSAESFKPYFLGKSSFAAPMSDEEFSKLLNSKLNSVDVEPIPVPDEKISELFNEEGIFSFENIKYSLNNTNLNDYIHGFNLKYPRKDFIYDFETLVSDLSSGDKNYIFKHFNFEIDENEDIKKYPIPNAEIPKNISPNMQKKLREASELVDNFMLKNEVILNEKDKPLENLLNETIKVFPEFITLIGKKQHRGDSMDFHTFDDIKRVYNNPDFEKLSDKDKKILFITLLFHDFSKPEGLVDRSHPQTSALYAKEIIKKLPLGIKDQERICNFIKHSHFVTDGDTEEQIAKEFKTLKDFKMIEILARADSASAGFYFLMGPDAIKSVQKKIEKLNN